MGMQPTQVAHQQWRRSHSEQAQLPREYLTRLSLSKKLGIELTICPTFPSSIIHRISTNPQPKLLARLSRKTNEPLEPTASIQNHQA
ncbi:hypothetical protein PGT21_010240 [Puccinia graminis f. sp. tritici]|uniref:Uncharacterized protein n=1 Tax=Puccinia graminis f. sp. tritici TaxID=56615 RepID=A0A5B0PPR3_PUCGR|nr:hypothetical protein PGT21_010240 [Puccinia graminis f. sp. tritici]